MASDAIAFLDAMEFDQVDLLGFSIGSFVAQEIALIGRRQSGDWCSRPRPRKAPSACTVGTQK